MPSKKQENEEVFYALIGDIGGTNVRFVLKRLDPKDRTKNVVIKEETKDIRKLASFEIAIKEFLKVS